MCLILFAPCIANMTRCSLFHAMPPSPPTHVSQHARLPTHEDGWQPKTGRHPPTTNSAMPPTHLHRTISSTIAFGVGVLVVMRCLCSTGACCGKIRYVLHDALVCNPKFGIYWSTCDLTYGFDWRVMMRCLCLIGACCGNIIFKMAVSRYTCL